MANLKNRNGRLKSATEKGCKKAGKFGAFGKFGFLESVVKKPASLAYLANLKNRRKSVVKKPAFLAYLRKMMLKMPKMPSSLYIYPF